MKNALFLLFFALLPALACSQSTSPFPNNFNKARLGYATSGAGLVHTTDSLPDYTPVDRNAPVLHMDSTAGVLYFWKGGVWNATAGADGNGMFSVGNNGDTVRINIAVVPNGPGFALRDVTSDVVFAVNDNSVTATAGDASMQAVKSLGYLLLQGDSLVFQINGSTGLLGQVVTASGDGGAFWGDPTGATLANNGVSMSGDTVQLGGTLTKNTEVDTDGKTLRFRDAAGYPDLFMNGTYGLFGSDANTYLDVGSTAGRARIVAATTAQLTSAANTDVSATDTVTITGQRIRLNGADTRIQQVSKSNTLNRVMMIDSTTEQIYYRDVSSIAGGGGSGTVTSITAGVGLNGGTITTSGTIDADTSGMLVTKSFLSNQGYTTNTGTVTGTGTTGTIPVWSSSTALGDSPLTVSSGSVIAGGTGFFRFPVGTTAQRPGTPATGMTRYSSTNGTLEYYGASAWKSIVSGSGTGTRLPIFSSNGTDIENSRFNNAFISNWNVPDSSQLYLIWGATNSATGNINVGLSIPTNTGGFERVMQLAGDYDTGPNFRMKYNGSYQSWSRIMTQANGGAGSLFNADLLDGISSENFSPRIASATENWNVTDPLKFTLIGSSTNSPVTGQVYVGAHFPYASGFSRGLQIASQYTSEALFFRNYTNTGTYTSWRVVATGRPVAGNIPFWGANFGSAGDTLRNSSSLFFDNSNSRLGIGTTSPARSLDAGEVRVRDLTTDTPTLIVGADADGDLGAITLGTGLSLTSGTLSATGGAGTVTSVGITAPAAGITVSGSPVTSSGSMTLALADDLAAVEGIAGTGVAVRTGTDTWTTRTLTAGTGISIADGNGVSGNPTITALNNGTVTSIGLTMPSGFTVGSSPVTGAGTIGVTTSLNGPLRGNGSGFAVGSTNLASEVTGNLPVANLNSGTGATSSSYWRGDGTWATPPGATYTAANGIVLSGSEFRLGGSLDANTTITGGDFGLTVTTTGVSTPGLTTSSPYTGIQSSSTSGSSSILGSTSNSSTNTILNNLGLVRSTTGTAANGIGQSISLAHETSTGFSWTANEIKSLWSDATHATRTSRMVITGVNAGASANILTLEGSGQLKADTYGTGIHTGTPAKNLAVTSAGAVIEKELPAYGEASIFGSQTLAFLAGSTTYDTLSGYTQGEVSGFVLQGGALKYTGTETIKVRVNVSMSLTFAEVSDVYAGIRQNTTNVTKSRARTKISVAGDVMSLSMTCVLTLTTNDLIRIEMAPGGHTGDDNITVNNCNFNITEI